MATYLRIKPAENDREVGGEGWNKKSDFLTSSTYPVGGPGQGHRHKSRRRNFTKDGKGPKEATGYEEGKMDQGELFEQTGNLFERLCTAGTLKAGYRAVKANGGSPGIDGVSIDQFGLRLDEELARLKAELESWSYRPSPVRRVEIPKPSGGVRLLGVPCIRDRVVQAGLKLLLEPLFDPEFSESSYGFRPGRNQRQAIEAAKRYVQEGKEHVVDIDLSKFFDRINHDRLLYRVRRKVEDKRIIRLIGITLRSGVMTAGEVVPTEEGTTQGSPLSPLLSNIVLDELDKELEKRGLAFCRFADDCNIFVKSRKAAERIMESVTDLLEKKMKLIVNREKSKVALAREVKFLGMTIVLGVALIAAKSMERAMDKIKELIPRGSSQPIERSIEQFNRWYRGWSAYYQMTERPQQFVALEGHARRRFRARLAKNLKRRCSIKRALLKAGVSRKLANNTVYGNRGWWALSKTMAFSKMYSNKWFEEHGMFLKSKETHSHWPAL